MFFARFLVGFLLIGSVQSRGVAAEAVTPVGNGGQDASGLTTFTGCTFVATDWADGDSFRVRFPDGSEATIRIYGADCIEWHVTDESDARRLRTQRGYFGLTGTTEDSIAIAREFGGRAATRTKELLAKPFTVYTAFADALGDQRFKRVYGFVETADGKDLATQLVTEGLARAHGVYRRGPHGTSADEYHEHLRDLELTAAKAGSGVWGRTDWAQLASLRMTLREEEAELSLAVGNKPANESVRLDPNTATLQELVSLPGIGEGLAKKIIEGRKTGTYKTPADLDRISGVGPKMIERLTPYLVFAK